MYIRVINANKECMMYHTLYIFNLVTNKLRINIFFVCQNDMLSIRQCDEIECDHLSKMLRDKVKYTY